jgi:hypothetical protein
MESARGPEDWHVARSRPLALKLESTGTPQLSQFLPKKQARLELDFTTARGKYDVEVKKHLSCRNFKKQTPCFL